MASGNPLDNSVLRFDDGFERLDKLIFRVEAGLMTFALLAMSLTYFLKIVFEAVIAERNFVDAFLLRWMHGTDTQPSPELVAQVHGTISPAVVGVVLLAIGVGAARTIASQLARAQDPEAPPPPWSGRDIGLALAIVAGFVALGWLVVTVPASAMCGVLYAIGLALFARRAARMGELPRFLITWAVLSLPIGLLISRIPSQYAWVNDLSKILIMYVGFLGASMASRERKHIVLNFGRRLWPSGARRWVESLSLLVWLLFDLLLLVLAWHLMELQIDAGSTLSILPVPEYHIVFPVVLSFALMAVRVSADLLRVASGKEPVAVSPEGEEVAA